ncbi:MAG: hypothetical protein IKO63_03715 [Paludibacteraceae bacterium]|nr:hypothetical protein [Paludibacteraceae bacterium]
MGNLPSALYYYHPDLEPIDVHIWKEASHDRWLIIDDIVYHCGHSFKDMGKNHVQYHCYPSMQKIY